MKPQRAAHCLLALGLTVLAGCATAPPQQSQRLKPGLSLPAKPAVSDMVIPDNESSGAPRPKLQQTDTPKMAVASQQSTGVGDDDDLPKLGNDPLKINAQDLPVPAFINEVFGNLMGLTVRMDSEVSQLQELVTLNTASGLAAIELYKVSRDVLSDYGVSVTTEDRVARFSLATKGGSSTPPLVVSGRALPQVPISHRPVFQLVELEVVRASDAQRWLSTVFGADLTVRDESGRNSLLLSGKPTQVRQALEALRVFDRPMMRGRISTRLEPAFLPADQLADRLVEVLTLQGYGASKSVSAPSSVIVLPIQGVNSVLVFAASQQALDYTVSWAKELDRVSPNAGSRSMFYYQVRNTKASDIAEVLNGGATEAIRATTAPAAPTASASPGQVPAAPHNQQTSATSQITVDEPRNALIFQGDAAQWERTLALIRQMDRAPRQVMMEVTIAEVTLDDGMSTGIGYFAKHAVGGGGPNGFGGSLFAGTTVSGSSNSDDDGGNTPGSGPGLAYYLIDSAGRNRMALTALANDSRVSVLSTPRLLVKSGSEAHIDIGTEVPTISMQTTSGQQTGGTSNLLQSVQYRKTGIILEISPTVYSDDRIDLDISQEVSEALPLAADATAGSPSIFNRSLSTSLSLRDGSSVVMAGMISQRETQSDSGIPLLKDVPVLGHLFKNNSVKSGRTELVLMIVPYIIESDDRATQVSQAIIDQFELLDLSTEE